MNILSLMKNAKKMSGMMEEQQKALSNEIVTGESGAGAVTITMDCKYTMRNIELDDDVLSDKTVATDLIIAAVNNATQKINDKIQSQMMDMGKLFGGSGDLGNIFGGDKKDEGES